MKHGKKWVIFFSLVLVSILLPLVIGDESLSFILINTLLVIATACAWSIFSGYTGYISLGHATYYGIGAYALALMCQYWHLSGGYEVFLFLPLAGLVAGAFAIPVGWIALHTRRYTFIIITIAIFFIFQLLAYNLRSITNGSSGIFLPVPTWSADLFTLPFYYGALVVMLLNFLILWRMRSSRFGLILRAVRDDEDRVAGLGIRVGWYTLLAYTLSATLTGMVGALAIFLAGFTSPSTAFDQTLDITLVTITFFGGIESPFGPLVGGLVLVPLQSYLSQQYGPTASGMNQILFGGFLLIVILLLPKGVVTSLRAYLFKWRTARNTPAVFPPLLPIDVAAPIIPALAFNSSNVLPVASVQEKASQTLAVIRIPRRPLEQSVSESFPLGFKKGIRSHRLVSVLPEEPAALQGHMTVSSVGQWRCPICRKPFLIKGNTCYCPRCGTTRPLSTGEQSEPSLPSPLWNGNRPRSR